MRYKCFNFIVFISVSIILCTCSSSNSDSNNGIKDLYFESSINKENHVTDFVAIADAFIENDILILEVKYTGGCKTHFFDLIVETSFSDTNPIETRALLSHYANGDECKMMVDEELKFDLASLKKLYQDKYKNKNGELIIKFMDNNQRVNYKF